MKKILLTLILLAGTCLSHASTFPDKPVKIITSLPVGSGPDNLLRQISEQLSKNWNVPVVVDNRPGGGGSVGLMAYNKEPANGYSLYYSDSNVVSYPILYKNTEIIKNIRPLAPVTLNHLMLFTSPKTKNFHEFRNKLGNNSTFGSWSVGSTGHMAGLELGDFYKIKLTHVPYRDFNQWFIDVSNQDVLFGYSTIASSSKMEQANKIKYVAYAGPTRHPSYPDVPTLTELTHNQFRYTTAWISFFINKGVPNDVATILERDIRVALRSPEVQATMKTLNYNPWNVSLQEVDKTVSSETQVYRDLVKRHNISID
jgi:tripartite-type tricarboxylate transporter receptor subunit TctC